jgi:hypothetical protein
VPELNEAVAALRRKRIITCAEAKQAWDGRWLQAAGLVLVRSLRNRFPIVPS